MHAFDLLLIWPYHLHMAQSDSSVNSSDFSCSDDNISYHAEFYINFAILSDLPRAGAVKGWKNAYWEAACNSMFF